MECEDKRLSKETIDKYNESLASDTDNTKGTQTCGNQNNLNSNQNNLNSNQNSCVTTPFEDYTLRVPFYDYNDQIKARIAADSEEEVIALQADIKTSFAKMVEKNKKFPG
jgi:hypothetical protein